MSSDLHAPHGALAERVTDLEIRLAYQDRLIATLDDVVRVFTARVETLEQALTLVQSAVNNHAPAAGPANDPPPHY